MGPVLKQRMARAARAESCEAAYDERPRAETEAFRGFRRTDVQLRGATAVAELFHAQDRAAFLVLRARKSARSGRWLLTRLVESRPRV